MGTGDPFPGGKERQGREADHLPHLTPRSGMSRSYTSSPPKRLHGVQWDCFNFIIRNSITGRWAQNRAEQNPTAIAKFPVNYCGILEEHLNPERRSTSV
jgi:hypothetical protein